MKAGAAVPMWPGIRSYRDRTADSPLAWDVYPQGDTSFTLYEDDGVTRQHRDGAYATQRADVRAPERGAGDVSVTINASRGSFTGQQAERPYEFTVHTGSEPRKVKLDRTLPRRTSKSAYEKARQGWWYDRDDRGGVVHVKTAPLSTAKKFTVKLLGTSAVGGKKASAAASLTAPTGQEAGAGTPGTVQVDVTAGSSALTDTTVSLKVPEGWKAVTAKVPGRIPAGATRRVAVALTPAEDAGVRETTLTALARYRAADDDRTSQQRLAVSVMPPPPEGEAWASDLVWLSETNGYGPAERDRSNGESGASDGKTLTLAGTTYEKGIGTHADSGIAVHLGGRCTAFTADVGIDDEINGYGEVAFSVEGDGKELWTSPKLTGASAALPVDVKLDGVRQVRLKVTDTNGSKTGDHGDWAAARFHCA